MSKSIRTALDRLCSDRELIKKSYAELEELERKSTAYDNAKEDLELAQAVRWFNKQPKGYREYYVSDGMRVDYESVLKDWREQKESEKE